ncbi:MAG: DUF3788 domain-containing protein [bacterium]
MEHPGAFTEESHPPRLKEVHAALDSRQCAWEEITQFIQDHFRTQSEWKYYGKKDGWILRYRKGGRAFLSLFPQTNGFIAQIVLSEMYIEHAARLRLGKKVRELLASAHPYPDGRWLFIDVKTQTDIKDIQRLLSLKAMSPKRLAEGTQ